MEDQLERILALQTAAGEALGQGRWPDVIAALTEARPLLEARVAAGTAGLSAVMSLQLALVAVVAGNLDLAFAYASLIVQEMSSALPALAAEFRKSATGPDATAVRQARGAAYLYVVTFVPFVPARARIASLEELVATGDPGGEALRTLATGACPKLDATGWATWPYPDQMAKQTKYWSGYILTQTGRGLLQNIQSGREIDDARQLAAASLDLLEAAASDQLLADTLNLNARTLTMLGTNFARDAVPLFERSINILERNGNLADAAVDRSNLGALAIELADFAEANGDATSARAYQDQASRQLEAAIAALRRHDPFGKLPDALANSSVLFAHRKQWDQALKRGEEAWALMGLNSTRNADAVAKAAVNLGAAMNDQDRFADAIPWFQHAVACANAAAPGSISPETAIMIDAGQGLALLRTEGALAARPHFVQAVAMLDGYRKSFLSIGPGMEFLKTHLWVYEAAIETCAALGGEDASLRNEAFSLAERVKWTTLTEILRFEPLRLAGDSDEALASEEQQLLTYLQPYLIGSAAQTYRTPQTEAAFARLEEIWTVLAPLHPEHVAIRRQETVGVDEARSVLNDEVPILVEYFLGPEYGAAFAFVVRREAAAADIVLLPNSTSDISTLVAALGACKMQTSLSHYREILRRLHDAVLAPVLSLIPEGVGLCIVPHGVLHNAPFAALFDGSRYLVERNAITIAASATALRWWVRKDRALRGKCLIFAATRDVVDAEGKPLPDLPFFEHLARRTIPRLFAQVKTVAGADANKAALAQELSSTASAWDVVHLACHGIHRREGFDSYLALAGDPRAGSTVLPALDIASQFRPDATLVTLSACESGVAEVASGDEISGLAQSFLIAGASSVIASLWLVRQDAGNIVLEAFYREWLRRREGSAQETKLRALQTAQCEALRKRTWLGTRSSYAHPYLWAAFQLYGNWG